MSPFSKGRRSVTKRQKNLKEFEDVFNLYQDQTKSNNDNTRPGRGAATSLDVND